MRSAGLAERVQYGNLISDLGGLGDIVFNFDCRILGVPFG